MAATKKKLSRVHYTSKAQDWGTPRKFFDRFHRAFRFTVDVCAEPGNAKLGRFWTKAEDGLSFSWQGERCWMNPEYKHADEWTRKARSEAVNGSHSLTVGLLPVRSETGWWVDNVMRPGGKLVHSAYDPASGFWTMQWEILTVHLYFHPERLKFEKPGKTWQAPFPSALIVWESEGSKVGATAIRQLGLRAA